MFEYLVKWIWGAELWETITACKPGAVEVVSGYKKMNRMRLPISQWGI